MTRSSSAHALRRACMAVAFCLLALATLPAPARVADNTDVSIKNFGRIGEHLYRGSQPTREEFAQLKKLGIKTVIDLRKDRLSEESEWVKAQGMQYFNIPLKASVPATEEQTDYFLSLVNNPSNWPVYIHCKGGRHRTGALVAVYRITHEGWTADQAWREMKEYDFDAGLFGGPAAQKKYVYSFYERYRAARTASGQK
jgi:tyrosine-protein phosphatase SIW14